MHAQNGEAGPLSKTLDAVCIGIRYRRLTPCMALESSMFAFGSACCSSPLSAVFLPTNLRLGCFAATDGSSDMFSSTSGPRFVAARSSSMLCWYVSGGGGGAQKVHRAELVFGSDRGTRPTDPTSVRGTHRTLITNIHTLTCALRSYSGSHLNLPGG